MADLYLQHEVMLDDENTQRQQMAEQFNKRMADLSDELNKRKEDRLKHAEKHNVVRAQIQKSIDDYKVKEQEYKDYMEQMNKEVEQIQSDVKLQMDSGDISKKMRANEKARAEFETAVAKCTDLHD